MKVLYGTVAQVLSGDTILLVGVPRGGPPPERQLSLSSIYAPKLAIQTKTFANPDQPFSWSAREYLRKLIIGKPVQYTVEYELNGKEFGSVFLDKDQDVGLLMLEAGLARVSTVQRRGKEKTAQKDLSPLINAEAKAKENKRGLWTDNPEERLKAVRQIQWLLNDVAATKSFVDLYKHQELPAVVEAVVNPGQYKVYFPNHNVYTSVLLSGISTEGFRGFYDSVTGQKLNVDPLALEGKYFALSRVLNRDLKVRIEGADDLGNVYGTFIHPKGNISQLLLRNGFTKIHERSINFTQNPGELREAQREAQKAQLRRWQNYTGTSQERDVQQEYFARVIEVISGDSLVISPLDSSNNNLDTEYRVYLASIRCPRPATRSRPGEPWAFEAKELVRKKLIGKRVKVILCYMRTPARASNEMKSISYASDNFVSGRMHFVSITLESGRMDIAELLVSKGLATVSQDRGEDAVAFNYDTLRSKFDEAVSKKVGIHSPEAPPKHHLNDLCGSSNANIAKHFKESLKRLKRLEGVVEHVINPSRFKIRIQSESVMITFALAGIRSPTTSRSPTEKNEEENEIANEAQRYFVFHYLQRDVEITVESCDRGGTFLGVAWCGSVCISVDLVTQGYAKIQGKAVNAIRKDLEEAQEHAKKLYLGIWSITQPTEGTTTLTSFISVPRTGLHDSLFNEQEHENVIPQVTVVHCSSVNNLYVQVYPVQQLQELQEKLKLHMLSRRPTVKPLDWSLLKVGKIVVSQFSEDQLWYRGRIDRLYPKTKEVLVCYMDYGNSEMRPLNSLAPCPEEFTPSVIPWFAFNCSLTGLKPPTYFEQEGLKALIQLTAERVFRCVIEQGIPGERKCAVQLFFLSNSSDELNEPVPPYPSSNETLNEELVALGLALLDTKSQSNLLPKLLQANTKARQLRLNVWMHGDVGDSLSDSEE